MNQIEREYKNALDEVRFSQEAKERMMKNLMNQQEQAPVKRRGIRPLRAGLIAAAVCLALAGTAGAANVIARQANINFLDSWDEYVEAQRAKSKEDGVDHGILMGVADLDYDELSSLDMDSWWNGKDSVSGGEFTVVLGDGFTTVLDTEGVVGAEGILGEAEVGYDSAVQTLVEESSGTAEDGWTAKRVFQYERDGQTYLAARYRAETLSGYDGLWNSWDTSWLEERYTSVPDNTWFEDLERNGKPYRTDIFGEFRGEGDTAFNVQYAWDSDIVYEDEYRPSTLYDYTGHYTTADGVKVAIETNTSHTGKTLFHVTVYSGHSRFNMTGTQVEMDELHAILDSLNLSRVLEYVPAQ